MFVIIELQNTNLNGIPAELIKHIAKITYYHKYFK